jgi:addiction module HigA family antidote
MKKINTILPGEILEEEFLQPLNITAYKLARDINISATRVSEIIRGKRKISIDTALRLAKYFGNSVDFWVGIQNEYDIRCSQKTLEKQLETIQALKIAA